MGLNFLLQLIANLNRIIELDNKEVMSLEELKEITALKKMAVRI